MEHVGRVARVRGHAPPARKGAVLAEEPQRGLRVSDVDGKEHACLPRGLPLAAARSSRLILRGNLHICATWFLI